MGTYPEVGAIRHTMTNADDGITDGKIYSFRWLATNIVGASVPSKVLKVAATDKFAAPLTLIKNSQLSSETHIHVEWSAVTPGALPGGAVLGYKLSVSNLNDGTSWIAFDG